MSDLRRRIIRLAAEAEPALKKDLLTILKDQSDPTSHDQNLPETYYFGKTAAAFEVGDTYRERLHRGYPDKYLTGKIVDVKPGQLGHEKQYLVKFKVPADPVYDNLRDSYERGVWRQDTDMKKHANELSRRASSESLIWIEPGDEYRFTIVFDDGSKVVVDGNAYDIFRAIEKKGLEAESLKWRFHDHDHNGREISVDLNLSRLDLYDNPKELDQEIYDMTYREMRDRFYGRYASTTVKMKTASVKPVKWSVPKGAKTTKGVLLKISTQSEVIYKPGQEPSPENVGTTLLNIQNQLQEQVQNFVGAIVKSSQRIPDQWGFVFKSHNPNYVLYPVRVMLTEHGMYVKGYFEFHLLQKGPAAFSDTDNANLEKFNAQVMEFESLFF